MPVPKADRETVKKVAEIARIRLTDRELDEFSRDLESVLDAFRDLQKADTRNLEPTFQPVETRNVTREDKVEKSLSRKDALKNASQKEKGYFKGPKAI